MQCFSYLNSGPKYNKTNLLANGSQIIGQVELGEYANVWFNSVVRGDVNRITIGRNTNIQDLSMLHVTELHPLSIGENVTVGHSAILHGCTIGDGSLIGMGSKILDGAIIGKRCLVAAGSIIPPGKVYPDESFIIGSPAKLNRSLSSKELEQISNHYKLYVEYAKQYLGDDVKLLS